MAEEIFRNVQILDDDFINGAANSPEAKELLKIEADFNKDILK